MSRGHSAIKITYTGGELEDYGANRGRNSVKEVSIERADVTFGTPKVDSNHMQKLPPRRNLYEHVRPKVTNASTLRSKRASHAVSLDPSYSPSPVRHNSTKRASSKRVLLSEYKRSNI